MCHKQANVACCHGVKLCTLSAMAFRSQHHEYRS